VLGDLDQQNCSDFEVVTIVGAMSIPHAWNLGVSRARGRILLFTESDCSLPPDWVEHLSAQVEIHGFAMGEEVITTSRAWSMSNVGIRAQLAAQNPFDERFAVGEDTEWFERLAKKGYPVIRQREPVVYHHRHELEMRRVWLSFLSGKYRTLIMLSHVHPQMNARRILLSCLFRISREILVLVGAIWGIACYWHMIPGKLIRESARVMHRLYERPGSAAGPCIDARIEATRGSHREPQ